VVWTYNGMSAQDMQNRILTLHQRQLASLVDDISRIEAVSYQGVGVDRFLTSFRMCRRRHLPGFP
jgi:multidrug efflux pump subunit AcrB